MAELVSSHCLSIHVFTLALFSGIFDPLLFILLINFLFKHCVVDNVPRLALITILKHPNVVIFSYGLMRSGNSIVVYLNAVGFVDGKHLSLFVVEVFVLSSCGNGLPDLVLKQLGSVAPIHTATLRQVIVHF